LKYSIASFFAARRNLVNFSRMKGSFGIPNHLLHKGSPAREQLDGGARRAGRIARGAPKHSGLDDNTADGQRVESQSRDAASLNPF
jgi:hypothetical protein